METQNEKISAGNETLAQENDARIEEKDLIGGSGNANGDSGNDNLVAMEPKKKTKKVVVKNQRIKDWRSNPNFGWCGNDSMPKLEVGGVDSSISVPVRADKSDACVTLSMEEAKNPDQPFGVSMEAETFKTMGRRKRSFCE
ncbi:hypothetical protein GH714_004781 [Hevea brasiliensis]|uniref:Uncharacterized protein n=1 Tax=Hevea brasiliensis TaxID=3981 RepID=A0A6A6KGZ4_HEVBR|nr:hypothetical protein GH714_004781 [Hevea brasiliensis]